MDLEQITKNRQAYGEFLRGKRVVIVGPAPSVISPTPDVVFSILYGVFRNIHLLLSQYLNIRLFVIVSIDFSFLEYAALPSTWKLVGPLTPLRKSSDLAIPIYDNTKNVNANSFFITTIK